MILLFNSLLLNSTEFVVFIKNYCRFFLNFLFYEHNEYSSFSHVLNPSRIDTLVKIKIFWTGLLLCPQNVHLSVWIQCLLTIAWCQEFSTQFYKIYVFILNKRHIYERSNLFYLTKTLFADLKHNVKSYASWDKIRLNLQTVYRNHFCQHWKILLKLLFKKLCKIW